MSTVLQGTPLADRVAVVTGASAGIGAATARRLAELGARVALLARRADRLDDLVAEIRKAGGEAVAVTADIADRASVQAAADRVAAELGGADLVVNAAGTYLPGPIADGAADAWAQEIAVNVTGQMNVIGAFTPQLIAAGEAGRSADLVNISSIGADINLTLSAVYDGSKAFVSKMSATLRDELGQHGVRVAVIEPGLVDTELKTHVTHEGIRGWIDANGELALRPEDVAETIAFAATLPPQVNLQTIVVLPTKQAFS
jgi:NADP-dependent 3-hydroxy acid dehydrogenase YdfG